MEIKANLPKYGHLIRTIGIDHFRQHSIWRLPALVHRLKVGMRSIAQPVEEQLLFLKTLRAYHLRAIDQSRQRRTPPADGSG